MNTIPHFPGSLRLLTRDQSTVKYKHFLKSFSNKIVQISFAHISVLYWLFLHICISEHDNITVIHCAKFRRICWLRFKTSRLDKFRDISVPDEFWTVLRRIVGLNKISHERWRFVIQWVCRSKIANSSHWSCSVKKTVPDINEKKYV